MEQLAAGFLSIGLGQNDRIFIAGFFYYRTADYFNY